MSYPLRDTTPGMTHHVVSRCIETKHLMKSSAVKELGFRAVKRAQKRYMFNFTSITLMDNHFHFIIQTIVGEASISRIMQYIKARIAEMYNKRMNRTGPFWNERFRDVIIEKQPNPLYYFFILLWYCAYNPVRAGICSDPRNYAYSSINCYLYEHGHSPVPITRHRYFEELGSTFAERVRRFLLFEEAYRKRIFECF